MLNTSLTILGFLLEERDTKASGDFLNLNFVSAWDYQRKIFEKKGFYIEKSHTTVPSGMDLRWVESTCMDREFAFMTLNYTNCIGYAESSYYLPPTYQKEMASCLPDCPSLMMFNATNFGCIPCSCNNNNTLSCNQTSGDCVCRVGFEGPSCDCIAGRHSCNHTISYCSLHGDSPVCVCRPGMYGKNLGCFEPLRYIRDTGVLEMYYRNKWMLIAYSYGWNNEITKLICKQLGLPTFYTSFKNVYRSSTTLLYSDYQSKSKITDLSCEGNLTEISQCSFSSSSYILSYTRFPIVECRADCPKFLYGPNCDRCQCNQERSLDCDKTTGICQCKTGFSGDSCACVVGRHFCDNSYSFCGDPTPTCYCKGQNVRLGFNCTDSLKLYMNDTANEGVLQMYTNHSWNTFCDDTFGYEEAVTACRQLHLPTRYVTFKSNTYSQQIPFWLELNIITSINCNGNETSLTECEDLSNYGGFCSHIEDVYLQCFSKCPEWMYGERCERKCLCNQINTASCDENTGQCVCKHGYFGDFCNCKTGLHNCNVNKSYCETNTTGNGVCLCKPGLSTEDYQVEGCLKEYIRYTNETSSSSSIVEFYMNGEWRGVCREGISTKEAQVVCRHLELPTIHAQLTKFVENQGKVINKWVEVSCNGTEVSLLDCERRTPSYCSSISSFLCPQDRLIRLQSVQATALGSTGNLQVFHNGSWGYICSSGFDVKDATVACREAGLPTKHVLESTLSKPTNAKIHLSFLRCNGDESNLAECGSSFGPSYCYSVVKITCNADCPSMKYGDNCRFDCPCAHSNTLSCDSETGECVCKPWFTGYSCNCPVGSHSCNTTVSDCYQDSVGIQCICKDGYTNKEHNCIDNVRISSTDAVEIFQNDGWKNMCSYNWKPENSMVICRQLNLSTDVIFSTSEYRGYSSSASNIVFNCNGTEQYIKECLSTSSTCTYIRQLMCGQCPEWRYSSDCSQQCSCDRKTSTGCDEITGDCVCHDGYQGVDCSCHTTVSSCIGPYSKCEYERCTCTDGLFNTSTNCSDRENVLYFCSFIKPNSYATNICGIDTSQRYLVTNRYASTSSYSWRPKTGSDNVFYVYVDTKPYYASSSSYYSKLNISIGNGPSRMCLYFDYVLDGEGSIEVSTTDSTGNESNIVNLSGTQETWTTKATYIDSRHAINMIIFRMEERTALDKVFITNSSCSCANWTFGNNCDECACVRLHTEFCNKANGQCHCKPGFTGEACQCVDNGQPCPHLIRLVNGNTTSMGRVEVVTNGVWSTVCDQGWSYNEASVVCNQLGLGRYGIPVMDAGFGKGVGPVYLSNVDCNGDEADLLNCTFTRATCNHDQDAGVKCVNKSSSIRLVGGSSDFNGRIEVRLDGSGSWGTVCDDGFSEEDARVACRELGLPTRSVEAKSAAYYGAGSGSILLSNLRCSGTENTLQECSKTVRPSSCSHYEDAGVSCSNDCPRNTFGMQCERSCVCEESNTLSCDKDTGECSCASGWFGSRCTCRRLHGCDDNSYCDGDKCLCNDGFLTRPSNCSDNAAVVFSCSFETDFVTCSINNYGDMKWRRNSRGTKSDDTGPYSAKEGIYYVYTEATGQSEGDEGVMEISLTQLNLTNEIHTCFQFYFHMRGDDIGDLNVIVTDKLSEISRWSKSGHYNSAWNRGFMSIPPNAEMLKIRGVRGDGYQSDIALDHLIIQQGHCECEAWDYGLLCEKVCDCSRGTSTGCDSQTGVCQCLPGWSGKTCNCRMTTDNCHAAFSYCYGNQCLCKDGQYESGVTCSGLNDIIYFCGFDMPDSIEKCNIELEPTEWEITEDLSQPVDDGLHLENNKYLKTRTSFFNPKTYFSFNIHNVTIEKESCLQFKYVMQDDDKQMLRVQAIEGNRIIANLLLQGIGLSTARIPLKTSSSVKIYIFAHVYNNRPLLIEDIIITSKPCVACSTWYYGADCDKMAKCNRSNTFSFDDNGICTCKSSWFGESCDCTKSENDQCYRQGEVCRKGNCTCRDGYTRAGRGCRDIDECTYMCNKASQTCLNMDGSYNCSCKDGTIGDGIICSESMFTVTNGSSPRDGTMLIWKDGEWGAICQRFDLFTALTACKNMFRNIYGVHLSQRGGYRSYNGISYNSILCDRKKMTFDLRQCNFSVGPCDTEKDAIYTKCGGCGGVYTSQFGLVEPPLQLPGNTLCTFLLLPPNARTINATFISFSMSRSNDSRSKRFVQSCMDSYIEAFDGPNTESRFLGRFCDNTGRFTITTSGSSLFLIYKTSRDTAKHDFQIIYETENVVESPRDLGESCDIDIQCVANNASCVNQFCVCHPAFYKFDEATCAEKKNWNSTCNENLECTTQYCKPKEFVCACPVGKMIIEDLGTCVDASGNPAAVSDTTTLILPLTLLFVLVIVLLVVAAVVLARKKGYMPWRRDNNATFTYSELMSASNPLYGFSANDRSSHRGSVISITSGCDGNHRIRLSEFEDVYEGMCDDLNWPEEEFRKILETCKEKPTDIATASRNKYKNRNKDVLPYDFNRLRESGTTSVDDYINASVIEGLHSHYPYYIVTQYPLITTQNDFWRMVWKQRASSIINLVSNNEKELYFPTKTGLSKTYGKFKVQVVSSLTVHRCTFRCMKVTKGSKSHMVNHFQSSFLSNFAKDECQDLINLINLVHSNSEDGFDSRPMVIHCLYGTGKSGVFVGMDYLIQLIKNGDTHVDLFNLAHILISNREKLIESESQYQFLFDCLDLYLEHDKTPSSSKVYEAAVRDGEEAELIEISATDKTTHFSKAF
ncbi:uncharacterized protein LOC144625438 isoform X3 [Crassostrea virginica]